MGRQSSRGVAGYTHPCLISTAEYDPITQMDLSILRIKPYTAIQGQKVNPQNNKTTSLSVGVERFWDGEFGPATWLSQALLRSANPWESAKKELIYISTF